MEPSYTDLQFYLVNEHRRQFEEVFGVMLDVYLWVYKWGRLYVLVQLQLLKFKKDRQEMQSRYKIVEQRSKNLFKAVSLSSEREVILKKVSFSALSPKKKEHIVNEVNTLIRLDYVHILRYLDYAINKKDVTVDIVMEYCRGGTLQDLINAAKSDGRRVPEEEVWRVFYQLAQALEYVHSDNILHRNLDPAHVYFAESQRKNLKLGGFNLSKRLDAEEDFSSTVLPQTHYLSPEQVQSGVCTKQTDVWALGCLIYELCALQPPFRSSNQFQRVRMIKEARPKKLPYSVELNRVVFWCLEKAPEARPSLSDITKTPEISLRIRERRYQVKLAEYLGKEERLAKKEKELAEREQEMMREKAMLRTTYESVRKRSSEGLTSRNLNENPIARSLY